MTDQHQSFRDRERKYRAVGGSTSRPQDSGGPSFQHRRKPKGPASRPGIPCRVKNSRGEFYDVIPGSKILFINESNPDGQTFPSHDKARSHIYHSIENLKSHSFEWDLKEFVVADV